MDAILAIAILVAIVAVIAVLFYFSIVVWIFLPLAVALAMSGIIAVSGGDPRGNVFVVLLIVGLLALIPWNLPRIAWREKVQKWVEEWWKR